MNGYQTGEPLDDVRIRLEDQCADMLADIKHYRTTIVELTEALQWIAAADTVGGISAGERKGLRRAAEVARAALAKATS